MLHRRTSHIIEREIFLRSSMMYNLKGYTKIKIKKSNPNKSDRWISRR